MITQNLHDYISNNKTEFFNELKCFLDGLNLHNNDFEYATMEFYQTYSNEPKLKFVSKSYFDVSFIKATQILPQTLNSLRIRVSVKSDKVIETKHRNFWGKETIDRQTKSEIVSYECRPFIFDYSKSVYGFDLIPAPPQYLRLEELKGLSSFFADEEKVVFLNIIEFIYDIISRYDGNVKTSENNVAKELSKIDIQEIIKDTEGIDRDLNTLISKNQIAISLIDRGYVHNFVKLSNFIRIKKRNIIEIHDKILDSESTVAKLELVDMLNNQVYSFNLIVLHSLSMLNSLIDNDLVTFYEIYESFDKLNVFNSNWENEVSEKLTNIGDKLDDLMFAIYNMERTIVNELKNLSYITRESFGNLQQSVNIRLTEINSSINTNNLLSGIQTYQLYKIKINTKGSI
jgi:hypothetical protein